MTFPSATRTKVVVMRRTFPEAAARLEEVADVTVWDRPQPATPSELKDLVRGTSGLYAHAHITEKVGGDVMDVVPHVASVTRTTRFCTAMMCSDNVIEMIQGELPPYGVNAEPVKNRR